MLMIYIYIKLEIKMEVKAIKLKKAASIFLAMTMLSECVWYRRRCLFK